MRRAPFDDTLAQAGMIFPAFVDSVLGWANETDLRAAGYEPVFEVGTAAPVDWVDMHGVGLRPEPMVVSNLRWFWSEP